MGSPLEEYYTLHCDEDARLTGRCGRVEFLTTMRYIEAYLKPGDRILEIGAGTGRYSHALAQRGHPVDAVELVEHNIRLFRENTRPREPVTVRQGSALDLSTFGEGAYDLTLLLGPLYHLYTVPDQRRALTEALWVTRPGGLLFAAYCGNDASVVQGCFAKGMLKDPRYRALTDLETFRLSSTPAEIFALHRREDVDALMEGLPARRLHFVGTDMFTHYRRDMVEGLDEELFGLYLQYHLSICERPDMVGISNHFLDVSRKE